MGSGLNQLVMIGVLFGVIGVGCSSTPKRPCTGGGQPAREVVYNPNPAPFRGTKKCFQVRDESGKFVNDGKYFEWYSNEKISIIGEYKKGKKNGRWIEYDEEGGKISDKYYDEGKEIPRP